jgi:hypothetical protein
MGRAELVEPRTGCAGCTAWSPTNRGGHPELRHGGEPVQGPTRHHVSHPKQGSGDRVAGKGNAPAHGRSGQVGELAHWQPQGPRRARRAAPPLFMIGCLHLDVCGAGRPRGRCGPGAGAPRAVRSRTHVPSLPRHMLQWHAVALKGVGKLTSTLPEGDRWVGPGRPGSFAYSRPGVGGSALGGC